MNNLYKNDKCYLNYYSPARLFVFDFADARVGGTSSCSISGIWRVYKQLFWSKFTFFSNSLCKM